MVVAFFAKNGMQGAVALDWGLELCPSLTSLSNACGV